MEDLELARAVARGDAAAIRRFDELVRPDIEAAARRFDGSRAFVDEVRQAVRVRLLVAPPGGRPRIEAYEGRGPLRRWVEVVALRVALNLRQAAAPAAAPEAVLADLVDREPDPELKHLKTLYRAEFRAALEAALAGLPDRQRALLRLAYAEGVKLAQIGALYGVHESTASRWVSQAAAAVADETRRLLVERLAVGGATVDQLARMVKSGLDLSIARILRP